MRSMAREASEFTIVQHSTLSMRVPPLDWSPWLH